MDGHEREDVVEYRNVFLCELVKIGFLHFTEAPNEDARKALLDDIDPPNLERRSKTVIFFPDKCTFQANDQSQQWGFKGTKMMRLKSKGAGIMVSDFIDNHSGFLALNDEEYDRSKAANLILRKYAREFLEYGESKDGYWTFQRFMHQIDRAVEIAEFKYPKTEGWGHAWVFDHITCHSYGNGFT